MILNEESVGFGQVGVRLQYSLEINCCLLKAAKARFFNVATPYGTFPNISIADQSFTKNKCPSKCTRFNSGMYLTTLRITRK